MSEALRNSERLVVVPYRPRRKILLASLSIFMIVLACAVGFLYSGKRLEIWREGLLVQRDSLIEQLLNATEQLEANKNKLVAVEIGAEVDRKAAVDLKEQLEIRQRQIAELNEELTFYRNLMSPQAGQTGLDAYKFLVYGVEGSSRLRFRLVMQQLGAEQKFISVTHDVVIVGTQYGEQTEHRLIDLLADEISLPKSVKFRYYHNLEGALVLPEGFVPNQVKVELTQSRRKAKLFTFDWNVSEKTNVG